MMFNGNKFFNSEMKKLYRETGVQVLPQCCPRHPNQHLLKFPSMNQPICPIDYEEHQQELSQKQADQAYRDYQIRLANQSRINAKNDLWNHSIVPDKSIRNASFDNFDAPEQDMYTGDRHAVVKQEAHIVACHYVHDSKPFNVIMRGRCGTGKSHLAMSILKYVNHYIGGRKMPNGQLGSCLFINVSALMLKIKDSFRKNDANYQDRIISLINNAYLVVLDDFGTEITTNNRENDFMQFTQRILYEVLNGRNRTIFTTNKNKTAIHKLYDDSIISRMEHNSQIIDFKHIQDHRTLDNDPHSMFTNVYDPASKHNKVSRPLPKLRNTNYDRRYNSYYPRNNSYKRSYQAHNQMTNQYPNNGYNGNERYNSYKNYNSQHNRRFHKPYNSSGQNWNNYSNPNGSDPIHLFGRK